MTHTTCPHCHHRWCPAIGDNQYLCPMCQRVYTFYPSSFEAGVKATSAAFLLWLAKFTEA
jgi:hypothetical protein